MSLIYRERPASGDPAGLLILHHGRGADEQDLLGLGDVLDPERRLHVVTPRAPLAIVDVWRSENSLRSSTASGRPRRWKRWRAGWRGNDRQLWRLACPMWR